MSDSVALANPVVDADTGNTGCQANRRRHVDYDEDIIDGFMIVSFNSFNDAQSYIPSVNTCYESEQSTSGDVIMAGAVQSSHLPLPAGTTCLQPVEECSGDKRVETVPVVVSSSSSSSVQNPISALADEILVPQTLRSSSSSFISTSASCRLSAAGISPSNGGSVIDSVSPTSGPVPAHPDQLVPGRQQQEDADPMPASCPPVNLTTDEKIEESDTGSMRRIVQDGQSRKLVTDAAAAVCKRKIVTDETRKRGAAKRRHVNDVSRLADVDNEASTVQVHVHDGGAENTSETSTTARNTQQDVLRRNNSSPSEGGTGKTSPSSATSLSRGCSIIATPGDDRCSYTSANDETVSWPLTDDKTTINRRLNTSVSPDRKPAVSTVTAGDVLRQQSVGDVTDDVIPTEDRNLSLSSSELHVTSSAVSRKRCANGKMTDSNGSQLARRVDISSSSFSAERILSTTKSESTKSSQCVVDYAASTSTVTTTSPTAVKSSSCQQSVNLHAACPTTPNLFRVTSHLTPSLSIPSLTSSVTSPNALPNSLLASNVLLPRGGHGVGPGQLTPDYVMFLPPLPPPATVTGWPSGVGQNASSSSLALPPPSLPPPVPAGTQSSFLPPTLPIGSLQGPPPAGHVTQSQAIPDLKFVPNAPIVTSSSSIDSSFQLQSADHELLIRLQQELNTRFLQDRGLLPPISAPSVSSGSATDPSSSSLPPFTLHTEMHQHLHHHQHHLLPPGMYFPPPQQANPPSIAHSTDLKTSQLESNLLAAVERDITAKVSTLFPDLKHRMSFPGLPPPPLFTTTSRGGPMGTGGGCFQPRISAGSLSGSTTPASQLLLALRDRDQAAQSVASSHNMPPSTMKRGKWCAAHVHVAWNIHLRKQRHLEEGLLSTSGTRSSVPPPPGVLPLPPSLLEGTVQRLNGSSTEAAASFWNHLGRESSGWPMSSQYQREKEIAVEKKLLEADANNCDGIKNGALKGLYQSYSCRPPVSSTSSFRNRPRSRSRSRSPARQENSSKLPRGDITSRPSKLPQTSELDIGLNKAASSLFPSLNPSLLDLPAGLDLVSSMLNSSSWLTKPPFIPPLPPPPDLPHLFAPPTGGLLGSSSSIGTADPLLQLAHDNREQFNKLYGSQSVSSSLFGPLAAAIAAQDLQQQQHAKKDLNVDKPNGSALGSSNMLQFSSSNPLSTLLFTPPLPAHSLLRPPLAPPNGTLSKLSPFDQLAGFKPSALPPFDRSSSPFFASDSASSLHKRIPNSRTVFDHCLQPGLNVGGFDSRLNSLPSTVNNGLIKLP